MEKQDYLDIYYQMRHICQLYDTSMGLSRLLSSTIKPNIERKNMYLWDQNLKNLQVYLCHNIHQRQHCREIKRRNMDDHPIIVVLISYISSQSIDNISSLERLGKQCDETLRLFLARELSYMRTVSVHAISLNVTPLRSQNLHNNLIMFKKIFQIV